ncbi:MAG: hypothetical protein JSS81_27685 [Acidobacteria bacterium]|nr:hypothetical protein [Acidobacteriota bacterium]
MSELNRLIGRWKARIERIDADFFFLKNKTEEKSVKIRVIRAIRGLFFFVSPESISLLNIILNLMPLPFGRPPVSPEIYTRETRSRLTFFEKLSRIVPERDKFNSRG